MTVHIDELHSEVTPVGREAGPENTASPWSTDERWVESCEQAQRLAARTASEAFDD